MEFTEIFGLSVYFLIATLGMVMVLMSLFAPLKLVSMQKKSIGLDLLQLSSDPTAIPAFRNLGSFLGSLLLGSNALTFFLAWMAFHDHEQFAWYALWYWPVMFFWHAMIYRKGNPMWYVQWGWLVLSVTGLLANR